MKNKIKISNIMLLNLNKINNKIDSYNFCYYLICNNTNYCCVK